MRTNGQIAYEGYLQKCGGVSLVSGAPLPKWEEQAAAIQEAWEAAGEAVAGPMERTVAASLEVLRSGMTGMLDDLVDHVKGGWMRPKGQ